MTNFIVGIDCGLDGGITFIDSEKRIIDKYVTPTVKDGSGKGNKRTYDIPKMIEILRMKAVTMAVLEKQIVIPKQGGVSNFSTGMGFGLWQGLLSALGIPYIIIAPKSWQKTVFEGLPQGDTKQTSILFAKRMNPHELFTPTARAVKDHHGLTDSYCLAYYGSLKF